VPPQRRDAPPRTTHAKNPASGVLPDRLGLNGTLLELGEEAIDDAALTSLVVQGLTHDAAGQVGRQATHLTAQRDDSLLPLRLDLLVRRLGDAVRLDLGLDPELGDDRRPLFLGLARMRPASTRASASWALYCSRAAWACC
jgi:hypothetical protein